MERDIPKYFHFLPVSFNYKALCFIVPFIYAYIFPGNNYFLCLFCIYFGLDVISEIMLYGGHEDQSPVKNEREPSCVITVFHEYILNNLLDRG